jgi:purine-binding chemotaxis protein CheW
MTSLVPNYLSFRVGREWFGVHVDNIIEVLHFMMLIEVPTTTPDVLGLIALRDTVMPVIDLRLRFHVADAPLRLDTPIITLRTEQGTLGMVVDEVADVEAVTEMVYQAHMDAPYIMGVAKLDGKPLLLLNADLLQKSGTDT